MEENKNEIVEETSNKEESSKERVKNNLDKQLKKSQEKFEGKSRILEYLKQEHKWENYLFVVV